MKFLKKKPTLTEMELAVIRKTILEELQFNQNDLTDEERTAISDLKKLGIESGKAG